MATVTLQIDGKEVTAEAGQTIIQVATAHGIVIPHYCYHPGLSVAGNCRMCLVDVEKMPKPVIACNTPIATGMVVHTNTEKVKKLQQSVMEFLLANHPLDCPTCDQAGECRLQDYYMLYDEQPSRFQEAKVEKAKMVDLGANVMLDQERCIACTRCIRVCQEVGGKDELALANRGDHYTITTFPGMPLSNKYAGNVIDVCPVGALTNKDFRFKKRVWFLSRTNSVCPGCSRGCNIEIHHDQGKVYRLIPRFNAEVNSYWICDEGRYGYHSINENRLLRAQTREDAGLAQATYEAALQKLVQLIGTAPAPDLAVVAHASLSNEQLEAIDRFARDVLKTSMKFYSAHEPAHPYSDDRLITADKNPNRAGLEKLHFVPLAHFNKARGVIVFEDLSDADFKIIEDSGTSVLAVMSTHLNAVAGLASVVLPIPTYAEQDGHFTNVQGKVQRINKAFEPRGESMLPAEILNDLSLALGVDVSQARAS